MANIAKNMTAAVASVRSTVKTSSQSAVNIVICLVTVGSEQLFTFAAFTCPCPPDNSTSSGDVIGSFSVNAMYGGVFILVPAIALFILGFAMNLRTWKLVTGCCWRDPDAARGYLAGSLTVVEVLLQATVAPCAWIAIAFLDGKYYACAKTDDPYDMECDDVMYSKSKIRFTEEYERNKQKSQILGWLFIASIFLFGSLLFMMYRWCSGLTYHHRQYMKWYREIENEEFQKIAKEKLRAQAKANIEHFFKERREKFDWDKISTVFNFTQDKKGFALYSRLDQWCTNDDEELLRQKKEQALLNDETNKASDSEKSPLLPNNQSPTSQPQNMTSETELLQIETVDGGENNINSSERQFNDSKC